MKKYRNENKTDAKRLRFLCMQLKHNFIRKKRGVC